MRIVELINLVYFAIFTCCACFFRFNRKRRSRILIVGSVGLGLTFFLQQSPKFLAPLSASILRDWLPLILMLLAYRQAGLFYAKPNERLQNQLLFYNLKYVPNRWLAHYLEIAYLLCYPLVPMGLAVLYFFDLNRYGDAFWAAVLPPTYVCYAMVPFTQTLPPRVLDGEARGPGSIRAFNLWILLYGSIQMNTLPSAHVAASLAVALFLLQFLPVIGAVFLVIAISIGVAAVLCRYHYFIDVLLGAILALIFYYL